MSKENLGKYKAIAGIGTILMGIGSFMSCLAESSGLSTFGTVLLIISIFIMSYGFYYWRP
ncbi:MAG: hypothetical protein Q4P25_04685 [Tissierellia bacterium]|nr:hypothetical protein [Tissierellia bacterium]